MSRTLSQATVGSDVRALQDVLNFHIRRGEPLTVDGRFGPKTTARVREFQRVNGLTVDGLVGPKTSAQLYEASVLTVPLVFLPRLQRPPLGPPKPSGGFPLPPLVPPLQWPGSPAPPPIPGVVSARFVLLPQSVTLLPQPTGPAYALSLKITVPTRKDPGDPRVASRRAIIELIDDLLPDSKVKGFLTSQVPNPVTKISAPPTGFRWGLSPLFDPLNPTGFGVTGNAQFMVRLTGGGASLPTVNFGAWGDGKFFLNFDGRQGQARPTVQAEGQVFGGVNGVF